MFWLVLGSITAACWYLALTTPTSSYPRDWRLKSFDLTPQEEQDFHSSVRKVVALTGAIFFSVCLVIVLAITLFGR